MYKPNLIQYTPSADFQRLLDKYGISLNTPNYLKSIPNPDAENILPRAKLSRWIHRLFSLLVITLLIGTMLVPTIAHASEFHITGKVELPDILLATIIVHTLTFLILLIVLTIKSQRLIYVNESPEIKTSTGEPIENKPKNAFSVAVGGATRKGLIREENQDAFKTGVLVNGYGILVVCDGVGGHPGGREAAQFASKYLIQHLTCHLQQQPPSPELLQKALEKTQRAFSDKKLQGMSTAIVAVLESNTFYYATLGDGDLIVIHPDGITQSLLAPHHVLGKPDNIITAHLCSKNAFVARTGTVQLEPNSLVLAMTDGVSELLDIDQIARNRQAYIKVLNKQGIDQTSDQILRDLEQARDEETNALLHSDNMTLAIAFMTKENDHEAC